MHTNNNSADSDEEADWGNEALPGIGPLARMFMGLHERVAFPK